MYREAQVRAGMALLDEKDPGWYNRLNLGTLNIDNARECMLGQLYGHYGRGLYALGVKTVPAYLGFSSSGAGVQDPNVYGGGEKLTQTWRELVVQRRQEHTQAERLPHASPERELVTA